MLPRHPSPLLIPPHFRHLHFPQIRVERFWKVVEAVAPDQRVRIIALAAACLAPNAGVGSLRGEAEVGEGDGGLRSGWLDGQDRGRQRGFLVVVDGGKEEPVVLDLAGGLVVLIGQGILISGHGYGRPMTGEPMD